MLLNKSKFEGFSITFLTSFFFVKNLFPYSIYLYAVLFIVFLIFYFTKNKDSFKEIPHYLKKIYLFNILVAFYILGLYLTNIIPLLVLKEAPTIIVTYVLGFYWFRLFNYKVLIAKLFSKILIKQLFFLTLISSILGLLKYFLELKSIYFKFISYSQWSTTTSLGSDYNFFSLMLLIGIIISIYLLKSDFKKTNLWLITGYILILSINILLAGSRRGIVSLSFLIIIVLLYNIYLSVFKSNLENKRFRIVIWRLTVLTILFLFPISFLVYNTSYSFKAKVFKENNLDLDRMRKGLNSLIYNYYGIIDPSVSYRSIDTFLWVDYNRIKNQDHSTPYNYADFKFQNENNIIFPLVNADTVFYSSSINGLLVNQNVKTSTYISPYTPDSLIYFAHGFENFKIDSGYQYKISTNCYISKSCDFDIIDIRHTAKNIDGMNISRFNQKLKGNWQNLELNFFAEKDTVLKILFFVGKYNIPNFDKTNGYVVYTYPKMDKFDNTENIQISSLLQSKFYSQPLINKTSFRQRTKLYFDNALQNYFVYKLEKNFNDGEIVTSINDCANFLVQYPQNKNAQILFRKGIKNKKYIEYAKKRWNTLGEFPYSQKNSSTQTLIANKKQILNINKQNTVVRSSENNSDNLLDSSINSPKNIQKYYNQRIFRWKYALKIYISDYTILQKILGKGFTYLYNYGEEFKGNKNTVDYPHNPVLSSLLYSGIIGGMFYLFFLVISFLKYLSFRKELGLFGVFYLLTFSFILFSGNSHFSVPTFTLLSLLPFIFPIKEKRS